MIIYYMVMFLFLFAGTSVLHYSDIQCPDGLSEESYSQGIFGLSRGINMEAAS